MRKKILSIIISASLLWTAAVALAGTVNVNTADFQGTVTTNNTNTSTYESRVGTWVSEDGSVFYGDAVYQKNDTSAWVYNNITGWAFVAGTKELRSRIGNLNSPDFRGTAFLKHIYTKNGNVTATSITQKQNGDWFFEPAKVMRGQIALYTENGITTVADNRTLVTGGAGGGGNVTF